MNNKSKYIGVEARVQYKILEGAIFNYLSDSSLDNIGLHSHVRQYTKGENRAKKVLKHINGLIHRNQEILKQLMRNFDGESFAQLSNPDRKALALSLFCLSFPITYDILIGFAQAFKVQEIVSKEVIIRKIGSAYGSNRAMHIAVTELIPLLIEIGVIKRMKIGIYSKGSTLVISNKIVAELVIYTDIKLSGSKSILFEELSFKPWFSYFDISVVSTSDFGRLLVKKDSVIGKGYITLKG